MLLDSLSRLQENAVRLREILVVLGKYGLADWLGTTRVGWLRKFLKSSQGQRLDQCRHEERIRLAMLELGVTFIKLGQMLSTRPDLVGPSLATELSKLQSSTPPQPLDIVRRTIESELGKPPEELFEEFCPDAMASASIGQVHRARLRGGQPVVVKVQHDGIEPRMHRDLDLLHGLAELAQRHVSALRNYRPVNTVREFRRTLLRELDLTSERRNLEEFARRFAGDPAVRFPRVYPELCGRRVLTMELLEGVPGTEVRSVPIGELNLGPLARRAGMMYLKMIFRDGFYHADPHPGNYVILPGGVLGMLDCGMVGRLDDGLREEISALLAAVAEQDVEELVERVVRLGSPPPDLDRSALRADLAEFVAEYGTRPVKELDLGAALGEVIDVVARYQIVLPANASLLLRTLAVLEGTTKQLDPAFSLMDLIEDYQARHAGRWLLARHWLRDVRRAARNYQRFARMLPGDLTDILHRLRTGAFEFEHEHRHLQTSIHHLVQGLVTSSLLLSAALLLSRSEVGLPSLIKLLLGLACLALAGVLGFRLLRGINEAESGRPH